eukprot:gnl/MRDRNA2_/MRDRNA2_51225_c0_seq1.p1 gnl/MRDRNA2_/MRDRNA2_51225_c0~~gnl/MRDRNA2_/MRDRNA2_51225_c0_seq1.p1  ORF type:complete len:277 (-),score=57.28 gnl/MRDRNA2_/MRDRNA2_51225_c0_seq1:193-1023(-)
MVKWTRSLLALCLALPHACAQSGVVIVTGATGRTGSIVYGMLKQQGVNVRGLVRNVSKARELLACTKCDESEGIFVGDITKPETLVAPMAGTTTLVIATSAIPVCNPFPKCHYPEGGLPIDVDWKGGKSQVEAFAEQAKGKGEVAMISSMGTTEPDGFLEKLDNGHIGFYKLNLESFLMSSGLKYTIVKPCGLDGAGNDKTLVVGHDDELHETPPTVARVDVARVVIAALQHQDVAAGLRFDLCSKAGPATPDSALMKVLQDAKYSWEQAPAELQV